MTANPITWARNLIALWLQSVLFIGWSAFCAAIGAAFAFVTLIATLNALGIPL